MRESDAEVMARSIDDPHRFASIFDRHVDPVRRFVERRVTGSIVDDVVAEVFRIGFERRAAFDANATSALPWLYGVAINVIRHHQRSWTRHSAALRRIEGRRDAAIDPMLAAWERVDAASEVVGLLDCLEALRVDDRDVLLLVAWEQLTPAEIAVALDVAPATVRTRLHRARQHVRQHMERQQRGREVLRDGS